MEQTVAVGTKFMQEVNSAATLAQLRSARRMSVSALALNTGLSRQAVSRSLAVLEADGYVEISKPDRSAAKSGRPPQMVRFKSELGYVVGIDVNPSSIRVLVSDLVGQTVADAKLAVHRGPSIGTTVRDAVTAALKAGAIPAENVWHVSIGAPGIVDPDTGDVILIPNLHEAAHDALVVPLRTIVSCPIYVDNDVKLATEGELWRGQQRTEGSLVFIDWGERIGAGIVLNGELYRGASNDSGDLGYLDPLADSELGRSADDPAESTGPNDQAEPNGPFGPFERWVGTRELLRIAADLNPAGEASALTLADLADSARRNEAWALDAVRTVATRFATGIAALRAVLDPHVIVIGGDIAVLDTVILDALRDALTPQTLNQPRLELSSLGSDAIVLGAVYHSLSTIERERFHLPVIRTT